MCGIAGTMDLRDRRPVDVALLERMRDAMTSRGPDGAGTWTGGGVGLAHRRLSIIDHAGGAQPMRSPDGDVALTYNGELYNHVELRIELERAGHVFASSSDTEVLLHAWLEWGRACVERLRGMFAFAVWDARTETLFLARDRLGIKPLVWGITDDERLVFASDIGAVRLHPGIDRSVDPRAVEDYFALGYVPDPKTIHAGIRKLEPGHCMEVRRGREPVRRRYWDVTPATDCPGADADVHEALVERLREAVRIRMVADVPLGAFLSGGVDSSTIVALMSELSDAPVDTCSIGFTDAAFDESSHADLVAARYATAHHRLTVDGADHALVDRLAATYGEPYADSSALPTLRVCELARRHVTVALSGDGADEVLAGYRRQRLHMNEERVRSLVPQGARSRVFGPLARACPKADWAPRPLRAKTTLQGLANDSVAAYLDTVSQNSAAVRARLFSADFRRRLEGYGTIEVFREHAERAPSGDPLGLVQYLDVKTYLPGDILTKVDRASMAHSLEVRVPFLDHPFVDWCFGLDSRHRLAHGVGKRALKGAMAGRLPADVLHRPKRGFSVPLASWTRGPLAERVRRCLEGERLRDTGVFDAARLDAVLAEHGSGRSDHSTLIWSILMFDAHLAETDST